MFLIWGLLLFGGAPVHVHAQELSELTYWPGRFFLKVTEESGMALRKFNGNLPGRPTMDTRVSDFEHMLRDFHPRSLGPAFRLESRILERIYEVQLDPGTDAQKFLNQVGKLSYIEYVEPVPIYRKTYTPSDYRVFEDAYHLDLISAEEAWDISRGSKEVVIAIVDDAVMLDHEDLGPNIWVNPGEIPLNGVDDDGNGYIDDVNGYDVATDNPKPGNLNIILTHGTRVAGCAAAATDNDKGVASIGFNCAIMAVKATNDPSVATSTIVTHPLEGIEYAIAAGADVVNMSFGGQGKSQAYQDLFDEGYARGMVFVAAAGNSGDERFEYPASYAHVISVAATDANDVRASFSTVNDSVDVAAPGVSIRTLFPNADEGAYTRTDGTSFASPIVAGLIGLMRSINPCATPDEIAAILKSSTDNIASKNPGLTGKLGTGRINAAKAVAAVAAPNAPTAAFEFDNNDPCRNIIPFQAVLDEASQKCPVANTYLWTFSGANGFERSISGNQVLVDFPESGTYTVTLQVTNAAGADEISQPVDIAINPNAFIDAGVDTVTCVGSEFVLKPTTSAEVASVSWTPAINLSDPEVLNPVFNATRAGGIYRLSIQSTDGCVLEDSVRIDVFRNPFLTISPGDTIDLVRGDTVNLEARGALYYEWSPSFSLNDPTIPNPDAFPDTTTLYRLKGIGAGLCESETSVLIRVSEPVSRVSGLEKMMEIRPPYPNPARDQVFFSAGNLKPTRLTLSLVDLTGREIQTLFQGSVMNGAWSLGWRVPSWLTPGIYWVKWEMNDGSFWQKWVLKP